MTQSKMTNGQRLVAILQSSVSVLAVAAILWTVSVLSGVDPMEKDIVTLKKKIEKIDDDLKERTAGRFTREDGRNLRTDVNRDLDDIRRRLASCERHNKEN